MGEEQEESTLGQRKSKKESRKKGEVGGWVGECVIQ